ncbi:MAG: hypothetical protein M3Y54_20685 [Bacteroidota bacterium]|nr:hypothetical protein [Bacteroidota bacterium]
MSVSLPAAARRALPAAAQLAAMRRFLADIGLETAEAPLPDDTFVPGIFITHGRLVIDPAKLLYPGDLLHEAGHLAVTPPAERAQISGNIMDGKPGQVGTDGEEIVAMLWSYAASEAIGLPPEVVFHPHGYKGSSTWIIDNFRQGIYPGLPLLVWMGLTTTEAFPRMTRWLRE